MIIAATPLLPEALRRGSSDDSKEMGTDAKDALMRAVVLCDEDQALEAVAAGSGLGRKERETGYTALHHASQYGMHRLAMALIDLGAPLDAKTRDLILQKTVVQPGGQTPLHLAAMNGEAEVVELLLERRSDPMAVDWDGVTPAVAAALRKRRPLAERLAALTSVALPPDAALETIAKASKESGRVRAAEQLSVPDHLRQVYTLERVWTVAECDRVLDAVKAAAADAAARAAAVGGGSLSNGWTTERHAAYATTDLPCSAVPAVDGWVRSSLRQRVLPRLAKKHGWLPSGAALDPKDTAAASGCYSCIESDGARMAYRDLFFVRYSAAGQAGLALHRDGSIISFNILLNDPSCFEGGGTYIEADDRAYEIAQGDCFVHSGKLRHGGNPITRGERYVLVGFIDVLDEHEHLELEESQVDNDG